MSSASWDPRSRAARRGELPGALEAALASPHPAPTAAALATVELLRELLSDTDAALEAGLRGGHARLLRALTAALAAAAAAEDDDDDDDDDDDPAAHALCDALAGVVSSASRALPPGRGFPLPPGPDTLHPPPPPTLRHLGGFLRAPARDGDRLGAWLGAADRRHSLQHALFAHAAAGELARELRVLVRPVPPASHRQTGQADVGVALWPAAPVLARWGLAHLPLLAGRPHTLELGAGIGLAGTAWGLFAAVAAAAATAGGGSNDERGGDTDEEGDGEDGDDDDDDEEGEEGESDSDAAWVTLTDCNPLVLHNLAYNAALNDPARNPVSMPVAHALLRRAHAARMQRRRQRRQRRQRRAASTAVAVAATPPHPPGGCPPPLPPPPPPVFRVVAHDWSLLVAAPPPVGDAAGPAGRAAPRGDSVGDSDDDDNDRDDSGAPSRSTVRGDYALLRADERPFDVIVGSDVICCDGDAHGVAATLARHLRRPASASGEGVRGGPRAPSGGGAAHGSRGSSGVGGPSARYAPGGRLARFAQHGGVAVLLLPPPFARYGVEALAAALARRGLAHSMRTVDAAFTRPRHARAGPAAATGGGGGDGDSDCGSDSGSERDSERNSDAAHLVVAGGRERELQLWVVSWPPPGEAA